MKQTIFIFTWVTISFMSMAQRPAWPSGLDSATYKFYDLTYSLIEKFNAGKIAEVEADLVTLKSLLPNYTADWNYTNALHKINITEGRLALKAGNRVKASEYLIKAGESITHEPSPHLKTFGPNMSLAKELLNVGERETVLDYFKICKKIWTSQLLVTWENEVINEKIPDFKANLFY
jgi:hypothetical protein